MHELSANHHKWPSDCTNTSNPECTINSSLKHGGSDWVCCIMEKFVVELFTLQITLLAAETAGSHRAFNLIISGRHTVLIPTQLCIYHLQYLKDIGSKYLEYMFLYILGFYQTIPVQHVCSNR